MTSHPTLFKGHVHYSFSIYHVFHHHFIQGFYWSPFSPQLLELVALKYNIKWWLFFYIRSETIPNFPLLLACKFSPLFPSMILSFLITLYIQLSMRCSPNRELHKIGCGMWIRSNRPTCNTKRPRLQQQPVQQLEKRGHSQQCLHPRNVQSESFNFPKRNVLVVYSWYRSF